MRELLRQDSWFMRIAAGITNVLLLNALFLISCLPIITIGAAVSSSLSVGMKLVKGEDSQIISNYWRSFRRNFKQSTVMFSVLLLSFGLILVDLIVITQVSGFFKVMLSFALILFSLIISSILVFSFAYLTRYQVGYKQLCLNCLYLTIRYPIYSITLILLNCLVFLSVVSSPVGLVTGIYLFTFGGSGLLALLNSWFLQQVFKQLEIDQTKLVV